MYVDRNFYPYTEQQSNRDLFTKLYENQEKAI